MGRIYRSTDKGLPSDLKAIFKQLTSEPIHRTIPNEGVKKAFEKKEKLFIQGVANMAVADRCNEIIPPEAWDLENFKKNPIILLEHRRDQPIGTAESFEATKAGLEYEAIIGDTDATEDLTADQIKARSLLKQGILRMNSVGFIPHVIEYDEDEDLIRYVEVELLEISIVAIPMQQDSAITSVKAWRKSMATNGKKKEEGQSEDNKPTAEDVAKLMGENLEVSKEILKVCKALTDLIKPGEGEGEGDQGDDEEGKKLKEENAALKTQVGDLTKKLKESDDKYKELEVESQKLLDLLKTQGLIEE